MLAWERVGGGGGPGGGGGGGGGGIVNDFARWRTKGINEIWPRDKELPKGPPHRNELLASAL